MIDTLLAPFAPHICYGCGFTGSPLCDSCRNDIEDDDFGRCVWCLKPAVGTHQCQRCARKHGIRSAWAVGAREGVLLEVVDGYKFEACRAAANELAILLDETLPVFEVEPIITWVPTTPAHIRERGFDHAALLARTFARSRGYRAAPLLARTSTLTQHMLGKQAREKAAQDAFEVRQDAKESTTPVLLIDDILTTGATLRACAGRLKTHEDRDVYVAVVCRQPEGVPQAKVL